MYVDVVYSIIHIYMYSVFKYINNCHQLYCGLSIFYTKRSALIGVPNDVCRPFKGYITTVVHVYKCI